MKKKHNYMKPAVKIVELDTECSLATSGDGPQKSFELKGYDESATQLAKPSNWSADSPWSEGKGQ